MSYRDRLIDRALTVAAQSEHPKWYMGAIVVRGSTVLSSACNKVRKTPWLDHGQNATFHAEEAALRLLRPLEGVLAGLVSSLLGSLRLVNADLPDLA